MEIFDDSKVEKCQNCVEYLSTNQINWHSVDEIPDPKYGWFAVAVLPRNHSGSKEEDATNLEGDNSWRQSFGFSKAWLNDGKWWEPDPHGFRSKEITNLVTHWAELPKVPLLTESFNR